MCQLSLEKISLEWLDKELLCGIIGCIYLLVLSVQDMRERMISGRILAAGALAAVCSQIIWNRRTVWECLGGLLIGIGFIAISRLTREGIGYGDSFLITVLGVYIGIWDLMYVLLLAFSLTLLCSMIVLLKFHFHKKKAFPFVPFITAGYMAFVLLEVL